jgi:hypothetical protein
MRRLVEQTVATGLTLEQVAHVLDLHTETVKKHYQKEIDTGTEKAISLLARSLYRKAIRGDTVAALFWLKSRAKWRDRDPINIALPAPDPEKTTDVKAIEQALYGALSKLRRGDTVEAKVVDHKPLITQQ